ncbi:MAG TPA: CotH kinase family protein [Chitinophagales bacterium]|nr:CotH kinase family protein [Chitinophagales bacterium]
MKSNCKFFIAGLLSFVFTATVGQVTLDSSSLPIIIINTNGQQIQDDPRITVFMGIIDNGPVNINHINDPFNNYEGNVTIEIRGSTSQMYPKKSYAFTPVDSSGNKINASLLGLPDENDWILYAPYSDKTLMRNTLAYHLFNRMGHYATRTRFAELVLNGNYKGVYELEEKIKRNANRVDIAHLTTSDTTGDQLTGGYIIKIDKTTASGNETWFSAFDSEVFFQYHDPDETELLPLQKNYVQNYVNLFETTLMSPQFADPDSGFRLYTDENSFIDFMLMEELGHTVDGYRSSCFMFKDKDSKGGKLTMGPLWDFNVSFGNANYCNAWSAIGWQYQFNNYCSGFYPHVPFWWSRMLEDPVFADNVKCRWNFLRQNFLCTDSINHWIDSVAAVLNEPQQRNFIQWPILGQYVDWNYYIGQTYADEIGYMKQWIHDRSFWIDDNLSGTCIPTAILENSGDENDLLIAPNPFSSSTTIQLLGRNYHNEKQVILFNCFGEPVMQYSFTGKTTLLERQKLLPGIYFIRISDREKILSGKLIAL